MDAAARVVVERPGHAWYLLGRDRWRSYWIEIDGKRVGKVRHGARLTLPVTAGRHVVQARIDWTGSPKMHIYLHNAGEVVLKVQPAGSVLDTWQAFGKDKWLTLSVAVD
jgi:hypothetical protein